MTHRRRSSAVDVAREVLAAWKAAVAEDSTIELGFIRRVKAIIARDRQSQAKRWIRGHRQ